MFFLISNLVVQESTIQHFYGEHQEQLFCTVIAGSLVVKKTEGQHIMSFGSDITIMYMQRMGQVAPPMM